MDLKLKGKRALVTGGSRGIGKAIAGALAAEGCDVVIAARGQDALDEAARVLSASGGGRVVPIAADVSDKTSVETLVTQAVAALGGLDILVNNAASVGGGGGRSIADFDEAAIMSDLNVKLLGYMRLAQAATPHMLAGGWGRIINIGGHATRVTGNFSASLRNAAITAWASNLANELGAQGINVSTVHPTFTATERRSPMLETRSVESNSIGSMPEAADVAFVVTMLASPLSKVVNGESIMASGGLRGLVSY